jgi:hypothetical protein
MTDTDEQAKAYVAALVEELHFANQRVAVHEADEEANPKDKPALLERVKNINAELKRVSGEAKAPAKRAEKRPAGTRRRQTR